MQNPYTIVHSALQSNLAPKSWRDSLRKRMTVEKLHDILANFAEGKAWMATLPDGRTTAPILPSSTDALKAAMFLHEALHGKAVAQTEIVKAEQEAKDFEAIRALDDDALEREVTRIMEARKVSRLSAGPVTDAEFTVQDEDPLAMITNSTPEEE